jgi:hippurate hydrolase
MRRTAPGVAQAFGASCKVEFRTVYSPTINHAESAEFAAKICTEVVGAENVERNPPLIMASEDFSFMLEKVPGCYFNIGNGAGEGTCEVHNPGYDFNDEALPLGATVFARLVETRLAAAKS